MTLDDLPALIELQHAGAVVGMAAVFPQDQHPFHREMILARWRQELADPAIDVYAAGQRGALVGFPRRAAPSYCTSERRSGHGVKALLANCPASSRSF